MSHEHPTTDSGPSPRVLIVEDHPMFRDALRSVLQSLGVEVIGAVATAEEAVGAVRDFAPELVIMDLQLADGSGVDATARIVEVAPATRVLVLTSADDDASVDAALRAGAHGYLHKSADPDEIVRAVQAVAAGDGVFDEVVVRRITERFSARTPHQVDPPFPSLTSREREVLDLVARGHSNAQIADDLYLSVKTIRNQVSAIFSKLGVVDRASAIVMAREQGLGSGGG